MPEVLEQVLQKSEENKAKGHGYKITYASKLLFIYDVSRMIFKNFQVLEKVCCT
jgi:hypothetical protein